MDLQEKVLATIQKYHLIEKKDKIVIGVSGGPDSMTLLNVLYRLKEVLNIQICVAHMNHMIRKEAEEETKYVQDFCKKIGIECYVKKVDVQEEAKRLKISTELAGRNMRYAFFEYVAQKVGANKIATAHNANDNAETVLMNLLRGSGISGLKGIEKMREGKYIRPIITCTRKEIEAYCKQHELNPCYDKSNEENIYTRNKVRNQLIPYLENEFNPNIVEGLNRLSSIVIKQEEFIHKIVDSEYKRLQITGDNKENLIKGVLNANFAMDNESSQNVIVLDLKQFNCLDEVIKARVILYTINNLFGSTQGIENVHIEDIIKLCGNNIGNKFLMPNKNLKVFVKKGKIFFMSVV